MTSKSTPLLWKSSEILLVELWIKTERDKLGGKTFEQRSQTGDSLGK